MQRPFDEIKEDLLEEVVLHLRDPKHFGARKFSHEEIAILLAPSKEEATSRMTYCNAERSALAKLKARLGRLGITSSADCCVPAPAGEKTVVSAYG